MTIRNPFPFEDDTDGEEAWEAWKLRTRHLTIVDDEPDEDDQWLTWLEAGAAVAVGIGMCIVVGIGAHSAGWLTTGPLGFATLAAAVAASGAYLHHRATRGNP